MGILRPSILALSLALLTSLGLSAQAPRQASTFPQFQQELSQWLASPENRAQKGWKSLKRWEDFEARHMNPDGGTGDPREYARTVEAIAAAKAAATTNKTAGGGWTPYGPNDYAQPFMDYDWIPGIGRINCVTFHPTLANTMWVGVAQGGVWKTVDGGLSWIPLTDDLPMLRISDIAVNPANPDEMYISVGDYAYLGAGLNLDDRKRHTHYGLGVYKTLDGGSTWQPTGLSVQQTDFDFSLTRRTLIHPTSTSTLVAAGTHGIWKSVDSGTSWTHVDTTFIWDIEADPVNHNIIYASSGYRSTLNYGSAGIMKSSDFGTTWTLLNTGIPAQNTVQRIELAISPSASYTIYALCAGMDAGFAGLYRSTDAGSTWELRSTSPNILEWGDGQGGGGGQGWYDLAIVVHPTLPDLIYTGGINHWGSMDGGATWEGVGYWLASYGPSVHADQHQLKYNPVNGLFYACNDGGLYSTPIMQLGSWDDANNVPGYQWPTQWTPLSAGMQTTSFYRIDTRDNAPTHLIAGAQDNATYYFDGTQWMNVVGGDGMDCFLDPVDANIVYGSSQYGSLNVSTDGGNTFNWISGMPEGGEWVTPWQLDPNDRYTIYAALGNVWKSIDQGLTWNAVSNFPVNPSSSQSNVSSAFSIAPSSSAHMYVSKRFFSSLGEPSVFWSTNDGGTNWTARNMGVPDSLYHTMIAVDGTDPLTAYVTLGGFVSGLKVMKTTDGGASWINFSGSLPNLPANCIVQDIGTGFKTLYVGMDVGVYYRDESMADWALYAADLPNVIVSDLDIQPTTRKLYAATFGRGIWGADLVESLGAGISDGKPGVALSVYPNPSKGSFSVRIDHAPGLASEVELVDVMGKVVEKKAFSTSMGSAEIRFDRKFAPGMYFVRVNLAGKTASRKVIIGG